MPGFTSAPAAREVTAPICLSFAACCTLTVMVWSAWTVMPLTDAASRAAVAGTVIAYVSGASEMNEKRPVASDVVVADCEGLVAVTRAPAMGWFV